MATVNHRPIRDITRLSRGAPARWGWTYRKLLAVHETVERLQAVFDEWPRPHVATDFLDALRGAQSHGAALSVDGSAVHVRYEDLAVSIVLPKWARALLRDVAGEVTL